LVQTLFYEAMEQLEADGFDLYGEERVIDDLVLVEDE
jgi:hypothetical protein